LTVDGQLVDCPDLAILPSSDFGELFFFLGGQRIGVEHMDLYTSKVKLATVL